MVNGNLRFDATRKEWVFLYDGIPEPPGCAPTGCEDADEVVCRHGVTCCCPTCPLDDEHYYIPVPPRPFAATTLSIDVSTATAFNYSVNTNTISTLGDFTITPHSSITAPEDNLARVVEEEERETFVQRFLARASVITTHSSNAPAYSSQRFDSLGLLEDTVDTPYLRLGEEDIPDEDF